MIAPLFKHSQFPYYSLILAKILKKSHRKPLVRSVQLRSVLAILFLVFSLKTSMNRFVIHVELSECWEDLVSVEKHENEVSSIAPAIGKEKSVEARGGSFEPRAGRRPRALAQRLRSSPRFTY